MTENNAAQAADQILTYLGFAQAVGMEPAADPRRDHIQALIESALLSKLRAEGVPVATLERVNGASVHTLLPAAASLPDGDYALYFAPAAALASAPVADTLPLEKALYELVDKIAPGLDTGDLVQDARRASTLLSAIMASAPVAAETTLQAWAERFPEISDMGRLRDAWNEARANTPVAGEAQPVAWQYFSTVDQKWCNCCAERVEVLQRAGLKVRQLDAAPQASEAVRILFPAHLRKMWSGGEVQAWLDDYQGITPQKASAKGSLERYRQWQAEQTQADKVGAGSKEHQ